MAFISTEKNGGVRDERISTKGRPKGPIITKRNIKERELLGILRKIKPHLSDSISTAASIMRNKEASHQNQLKAAVILLSAYKELVGDVYETDDAEEEGTEVQPQNTGVVFSMKMINTDSTKTATGE